MPRYLLTVWHDHEYELDFTTEEAQRMLVEVGRFNADREAAHAWARRGAIAGGYAVEVRQLSG